MANRFAVLLGNQLYEGDWQRLDGVPTDYVRMQTYLSDTDWVTVGEKLNFNVRDMESFWVDVDKRIAEKEPAPDSELLLYYSGHGQVIEGEWQAVVKSGTKHEKLQFFREAAETARVAFDKPARVHGNLGCLRYLLDKR